MTDTCTFQVGKTPEDSHTCGMPAVVVYVVAGSKYPACKTHDTPERRQKVEDAGYWIVEGAAA